MLDMLELILGDKTASGEILFEKSNAQKKIEKTKKSKDELILAVSRLEKTNENVLKALSWLEKNEEKLEKSELSKIEEKLKKGVEQANIKKLELEEMLDMTIEMKDLDVIKREIESNEKKESGWDF